jgi:hypothetical protein
MGAGEAAGAASEDAARAEPAGRGAGAEAATRPDDRFVVDRWHEFEGEERANVLRVVGLGLFYGVQLVNHHGLSFGPVDLAPVEGVDARFHALVTALAVTWAATAGAVAVALRGRFFPRWIKYATTAIDFALVTAVLCVADGPRSPLVVVLFPLLALASLRGSTRLVAFATCAALLAYGAALGNAAWLRKDLLVPPYQAVLAALSLALCGYVLWSAVGRGRAAADELAARRLRASLAPPAPPAGPGPARASGAADAARASEDT